MGTFNTLHVAVTCSNCKTAYNDKIQFAYGDVWQHHYKVGDEILWDINNVGVRDANRAIVYGISELDFCPICGISLDNEYDIVVVDNRIVLVKPMEEYSPYRAEEGGRFYIPSG
jgi:hypothetical protein